MKYSKTIPAVLIAAGLMASSGQAEASVPGKEFTETACQEYSDSIARLYTAGLGRETERGGFEFWMEEYTAGNWSFSQIAQFFVDSEEFTATYGDLDNDGFVRQLYRNVLGREGDAGGIEFWVGEIVKGKDRAAVLMRFAESPENIARSGTEQPSLGDFNEGRDELWRCGPDLSDHLLQLADLPAGWVAFDAVEDVTWGACNDLFRNPSMWSRNAFQTNGFQFVTQSSASPMSTQLGVDRFFDHIASRSAECASFMSTDEVPVLINIAPLSFPTIGERTSAFRISYRDQAGQLLTETDMVFFEVGTTIGNIHHFPVNQGGPDATQWFVERLYDRLAPVSG